MKHSDELIKKLGFGHDWSDRNKQIIEDFIKEEVYRKTCKERFIGRMEGIKIVYHMYESIADGLQKQEI